MFELDFTIFSRSHSWKCIECAIADECRCDKSLYLSNENGSLLSLPLLFAFVQRKMCVVS